ncbi:MAG: Ig-like domain-containing protein, partial [Pseudomonadota bacterium]
DSVVEDGDETSSGNVLTNDTDVDGDALTITGIAAGSSTGTVGSAFSGSFGTLTLNADGSFSYALTAGGASAGDATETFTYTVSDGTATDTATLTFDVTGVNDAVTAVADSDAVTEDTDLTATGSVLSNDIDPDPDDTLTVTEVNGDGDSVGTDIVGSFGTFSIDADGSYSYTLDNAATAIQSLGVGETETDSISYTVSDGEGTSDTETLTITINGSNDAPVAGDDFTVTISAAFELNPLIDDPVDPDGDAITVTFTEIPNTAEVGLTLDGEAVTEGLSIPASSDATLEAIPVAGFDGTTSLTLTYSDGNGGTDTQVITIIVDDAPNTPPETGDDFSVAADGTTAVALGIEAPTDAEGGLLTITIDELPSAGILRLEDGTEVTSTTTLTIADLTGLTFEGTATDFGLAGQFVYSVTDTAGASDDQTVTLSVVTDTVSLDGLTGSNGSAFNSGATTVSAAGIAIGGDGDVDGDGFDDLIFGIPGSEGTEGGAASDGVAIVLFGSADGFSADASLLAPTSDFLAFNAPATGSLVGTSVDIAGDFNDDGFDDIAIGAVGVGAAGVLSGSTFLIGGSASRTAPDLGSSDTGLSLQINGLSASEQFGTDVALVGDVNNDGIDDFGAAAAFNDGLGGVAADAGIVGIAFGSTEPFPDVLSFGGAFNDPQGEFISGGATGDESGVLVALGDINGDDVDDFAVGAENSFSLGSAFGTGFVSVIFGIDEANPNFIATTADQAVDGSTGFNLFSDNTGDMLGQLGAGGDFNGDGLNDVLFGAPGVDGGAGADAGAFGIIFGSTTQDGVPVVIDSIDAEDGFLLEGFTAGAALGTAVSGIGDFNGDDIDDFAVSAPGAGANGSVFVVFGTTTLSGLTIDLANPDGTSVLEIEGVLSGTGAEIEIAGDVNGDGFDDILLTANDGAGVAEAYLVFGFDNDVPGVSSMGISAGDDGIDLAGFAANGARVQGDALPPLSDVVDFVGNDLGNPADIAEASEFRMMAEFDEIDLTAILLA